MDRLYVVLSVIVLALLTMSGKQHASINYLTSPFDTLSYDKVVAYDYDGQGGRSIVMDNQLMYRKKIFMEKELNENQIKKLHRIVNNKKTYGGTKAGCFDPHLGIVYYNQKKIVGHISICLSCNFLSSSMKIPAIQSHKVKGSYDFYREGFSKNGRIKISELCKELEFSHWQLSSE